MSSFSFTASTPMSPHHRRHQSPLRDSVFQSPLPSPARLARRLSGSTALTPPSSSKSVRRSSESYSECDRFIPSRAASNLEDPFERMESNDPISRQENQGTMNCLHNNQNMMNNLIRSELLWEPLQSTKSEISASAPSTGTSNSPISSPVRSSSSVLRFSSASNSARRFSQDSTSSNNSPMGNSRSSFGPSPTSQRMARSGSKKSVRKISRIPYKVLDAPALQDDYYLNLVDWSSTNFLSVALGNSVYLWSASNLKVVKLCELEAGDSVTAISWALKGNQLAVGTNTGKILIWDTVRREQIRELTAHTSRVGTLAWNSTVVASGSRDRNIYVHDIRMRGSDDSASSPSSSSTRTSFQGRNSSIGGATRSGTYGETIGTDRRRSRDEMSSSSAGDESDEEYSDVPSSSISDVTRQQRAEARAVRAVRESVGMDPLPGLESGIGSRSGSRVGGRVVQDNNLSESGGRLFGDEEEDDDLSGDEESYSLFDDARQSLDDPSSSSSRSLFRGASMDSRLNMDMSTEGEGYVRERRRRSGDIEREGLEEEEEMETNMDVDNEVEVEVEYSSGTSTRTRSDHMDVGSIMQSDQSSSFAGVDVVRSPVGGLPSTLRWSDIPAPSVVPVNSQIDSLYDTVRPTNGMFDLSAPVSDPVGGAARGGSCVVGELIAHKQEVCGLKWSFDERLLASGGNDNKLYVWAPNLRASGGANSGASRVGGDTYPVCEFSEHIAAVKAVGWSPHQHGTLASGGGTADKHIRFWNALTATPLHRIDTGSQVCNLMWSKNVNEIVSTHGYSLNQVIVWKYPTMQKIATLTGHTLRVLYLAMSPDGQSIVTGAGDESLRFWNIFPSPRGSLGMRVGPSLLLPTGSDIR